MTCNLGAARALTVLAIVLVLAALPGCRLLSAAAPALLDVTERVLRHELDTARDVEQQAAIQEALRLLEEARAAQAGAEDAARRAEHAAEEAHSAAVLAEVHKHAAEAAARSVGAQQRLAAALQDVRPPAPAAPSASDVEIHP